MLLIKNKKININQEYFKKIKSILKNAQVKYSLIGSYPYATEDIKKISQEKVLIIFGGDGTILKISQYIKNYKKTFILPINFGNLGYITSVQKNKSIEIIKNIIHLEKNLKNKILKLDNRCLLKITNKNNSYLALNELIVKGMKQGKPIRFEVFLNNKNLIRFKGDGILVSTATGSSAYNLSAGGPILAPDIEAFILTPISPHSLNLKPIVVSKYDKIEIIFEKKHVNEKIVIIDGEKLNEKGDFLVCQLSSKKLSFIKPFSENHFQILSKKLFWGKNNF